MIILCSEELRDWGRLDASDEAAVCVAPGVQHKYEHTVLLLCNEVCGAYCRFCFRKLTCTDCHAAAGFFFGLPERPVGEVRIEDASFSFAENAEPFPPAMMDGVPPCARMGLHFENVAAVALRNMTLSGVRGERVTTSRVGALTEEMGCPRS